MLGQRLSVAILFFAGVACVYAEEPRDHPRRTWELTVEERLERRLDPALRSERIAEESRSRLEQGLSAVSPRTLDVIDGSKHPELFLPFELFDDVVQNVETVAEGGRPLLKAEEIRGAGLDPDLFWRELQTICAHLLEIRMREHDLVNQFRSVPAEQREMLSAQFNAVLLEKCKASFDALEAAHRRFGRDQFDRLLYSSIAPRSSMAITRTSVSTEGGATNLRRLAEGCQ